MVKMVRAMKALSDPTRLKIVKMLNHRKSMCVCEIQAVLGIAQPSVSKHLKVLENAEIVEPEREGVWVNYCLRNIEDGLELAALLDVVIRWMDRDEQLARLLKLVDEVDRNNIVN